LLALVYALYAAFYIYNSSFVVEGKCYYCLFDDAMISMRYARNWVDGQGLVWNPGERVEGYSNFLWTAVMAGVHLLPLPDRLYSLAVQVLCVGLGLLYVWGTYRLGRALRLERAVCAGGAALTALYFSLTTWTLQGMETGLLTVLVVWGAAVGASAWRRHRVSLTAGLLFGGAMLTRPDGLLLVGAVCVLFAWRMRRAWRASLGTLVIALVVEGAYWLWRWRYYGDFWPNTFYLKLGLPLGFRLGVLGLDYLSSTLYRLDVVFISAVVLTLMALRGRARWDLIGVFGICLAYLVWVGGDAWPYDRFICPGMPFAALGVMHGICLLVRKLVVTGPRAGRERYAGVTLACSVLLAGSVNYVQIREWLGVVPYSWHANRANVRLAEALVAHTTPDARVATFWAGAIPYFSRRYAIDILGKSDPYIARDVEPVLSRDFPPGHGKFDLRYSLLTLHADVLDMPGGRIWPDLTQEPWFQQVFRPNMVSVGDADVLFYVRRISDKLIYP
jgi:arabinofuranosyltransferase